MIKGGFQGLDISGVDLTAQSPTLPGGYAACAAAAGKTVLVLTATGAVQCSVKKVSTNYVLAGITGDGKILSITIGSTDGISVSEAVIPSGGEEEEYIDASTNISTATSTNPYTAEYDGIVRLYTGSSTTSSTASVLVKTGTTQSAASEIITMASGTPASTAISCFVKKGTVIYPTLLPSGVSAVFLPYKPVES